MKKQKASSSSRTSAVLNFSLNHLLNDLLIEIPTAKCAIGFQLVSKSAWELKDYRE
ncbi:unnamed protein product [Dovyalis caffra]|uniref:Uncharacterized protein n=1 Tax=Dovyalis caffra TaxID=77055 RepID=A0AAV1S0A1_9ROSI|nr:unnamed protein product [Dovyalis caffra]